MQPLSFGPTEILCLYAHFFGPCMHGLPEIIVGDNGSWYLQIKNLEKMESFVLHLYLVAPLSCMRNSPNLQVTHDGNVVFSTKSRHSSVSAVEKTKELFFTTSILTCNTMETRGQ
jgi:hypothetical protein